jgi:flagellar basal body-associated protein FliL
MKINKNKKNRILKIIALITLILVVAIACYLVVVSFMVKKTSDPNTEQKAETPAQVIDETSPTQEQLDAANDIKEEANKNNPSTESTAITAVASLNEEVIRVQTTINKVTNDGTCTLTFTKGSISKIYTAGVQALSSYSTCKGFTVDSSELSSGTWNINVTFVSGSVSSSAKTSIDI